MKRKAKVVGVILGIAGCTLGVCYVLYKHVCDDLISGLTWEYEEDDMDIESCD